jgi:hypothetical protein
MPDDDVGAGDSDLGVSVCCVLHELSLQSDVSQGAVTYGQPIQQDWPAFEQAVIALADDAG